MWVTLGRYHFQFVTFYPPLTSGSESLHNVCGINLKKPFGVILTCVQYKINALSFPVVNRGTSIFFKIFYGNMEEKMGGGGGSLRSDHVEYLDCITLLQQLCRVP